MKVITSPVLDLGLKPQIESHPQDLSGCRLEAVKGFCHISCSCSIELRELGEILLCLLYRECNQNKSTWFKKKKEI